MSHLDALQPLDRYNRKLQSNVHPTDWTNPTPSGNYNFVVVGAGTAGLVAAAGAAGLGAKVALVERGLLGGDCLNVGCVPSKAILAAARRIGEIREAGDLGIKVPEGTVADFGAVMERMRRLRSDISPHDSAERFRELGIDVFLGQGKFTSANTLEVGGTELRFAKACIATGARASAPSVPGLEEVDYLTNETLFSLTELPRRFGVLGGGPIGVEMAQAFARLGSEVTLVVSSSGILPKEDRDAAAIVRKSLERDGITIHEGGRDLRVERGEDDTVRLRIEGEKGLDVTVDRFLVAVGRVPNVEGLGLEDIGVEYSEEDGVIVDDRLRTTVKTIYAAGDVCSKYQFTHAADFMARTVIGNALFHGRSKASGLVIPWSTYCEPELSHVGLTPTEAKKRAIEIDTYTLEFEKLDRAILSGQTEGFVRVHTKKGKGEIVGATVVGPNAGDLISQFSVAMTHGLGLGDLARTIAPYPTIGEAVRKTGDLYRRTRLTPFVAKLMEKWFSWTR